MRLVVIGQAAFGAKTVEALLEKGEEVSAVFGPSGRPGARPDPIAQAAEAGSIPYIQPATYKSEETFARYRELRPDLAILAFVTDIIPTRYFEAASQGAICYHPSLLPRHRGSSAINWAIIMGDKRTGLSIFWPDRGIDTGPVLLQKEVEIGPADTTGSIYFNRLFPLGIEAILESVALVKAGKAPRISQDNAQATYEPPCTDRHACIDWQAPADRIHDLIRGCDPQPGAYTLRNGEKIRFYGPQILPSSGPEAPGTLTAIHSGGIQVAVSGGTLRVNKVKGPATGKLSADQWAVENRLTPGDLLTDPYPSRQDGQAS